MWIGTTREKSILMIWSRMSFLFRILIRPLILWDREKVLEAFLSFRVKYLRLGGKYGGEQGIRTLEWVAPLHAFQACALNHSANSPVSRIKIYLSLNHAWVHKNWTLFKNLIVILMPRTLVTKKFWENFRAKKVLNPTGYFELVIKTWILMEVVI